LDDSLTPQLVACLFVHARLHLEAVLPDFGGLYWWFQRGTYFNPATFLTGGACSYL